MICSINSSRVKTTICNWLQPEKMLILSNLFLQHRLAHYIVLDLPTYRTINLCIDYSLVPLVRYLAKMKSKLGNGETVMLKNGVLVVGETGIFMFVFSSGCEIRVLFKNWQITCIFPLVFFSFYRLLLLPKNFQMMVPFFGHKCRKKSFSMMRIRLNQIPNGIQVN